MAESESDIVRPLLVVGGLLLANKVLAFFGPDTPPAPPGPPPPPPDPPTLTEAQLRSMAGQLEALLTFYVTEDEESVIVIILQCNTTGDVARLIHYYGDPFNPWQLRRMTLPEAIASYLSPANRADLNARLRAKGINFSF